MSLISCDIPVVVIIGTCHRCRAGPHIYLSDITLGHNSRIAHLTRWTFSDTCLFPISLVILASWRCLWKISSVCYLMYQSIPKPPIPTPPRPIPRHLTRLKLRTVGNLPQNEAHPVGQLTFVVKRLSAVGSERISQFFDSAGEPRSRVLHVGFSVVVVLHSSIVEYAFG